MINESKSGFQRLGFIHNNTTYAAELRKLSQQCVDYGRLNEYLDSQWDTKETSYLLFNSSLERTTSDSVSFLAIDTGYKTPEGKTIYGGFSRKNEEDSLSTGDWYGVTIRTLDEMLDYWRITYLGLASYTYIPGNDYGPLSYVLCKMTEKEISAEECAVLCQQSYAEAKKQNAIGIYTPATKPPFSYFRMKCETASGQPIFLLMEKNTRNGVQPWWGALAITQETLLKRISDCHCVHYGMLHFENRQAMQAFLQDLAEDAMDEAWTLSGPDAEPFGVLRNYLEHTLDRLLEEDRETEREGRKEPHKVDEYGGKVYFNTGLLNHLFRQIILVGEKEQWTEQIPVLGEHTFFLMQNLHHYSETDSEITNVYDGVQFQVPHIAEYFNSYDKVFFDASLPIQLNDYHIFEDGVERGRLPKYSEEWAAAKSNPEAKNALLARIARDFSSALQRARLMAERNYKLAVPQYWMEDNDIQLLLPVYLGEREENGRPECALALKKITNGRAPYYRGATILTLDMAYNNSRLLAKPDVFWLRQR